MLSLASRVEQGLDRAAKEIRDKMLEPTSTWNHKPEVKIESSNFRRKIFTSDKYYVFVEKGTKPHPIFPKKARALKIQEREPKTRPRDFRAYDSEEGDLFFAAYVKRQRIKPRLWTEELFRIYKNRGRLAEILRDAIHKGT